MLAREHEREVAHFFPRTDHHLIATPGIVDRREQLIGPGDELKVGVAEVEVAFNIKIAPGVQHKAGQAGYIE